MHLIANITNGVRLGFYYNTPGKGFAPRMGRVDRIVRTKNGKIMVTIKDETKGEFRSFDYAKMENLSVVV